ncbi:MAG: FecR domain-containing protein, partial [Polyangiales bacterium]
RAAALAPARVEHGARRRVSGLQVLALGGALAAAVALGLWAQSARPNAARPTLAAKPAKSGAVASAPIAAASPVSGPEDEEPDPDGEHVAASSAPQPEDGVLHAPEGATVILAHAEVELRPGTEARWDRGQRTLVLSRGSVLADVDPSAHERFTVKTPGFEVVVLGTRFEVTLEGVSVLRGRVRVLASDGRVLAQALGPGERFALGQETAPAPTPESTLRQNKSPNAPQASSSVHADSARPLLERARTALAERQVDRASALVEDALRLAPPPPDRAEALTLRAECALVAGKWGNAISGYLQVADSFAELRAGENALFAAARLQQTRGQRAAAARSFERYLARYPSGRFAKEATTHLRELRAESLRGP